MDILHGHYPWIASMGHMDTVHPIGTIKKLPFRIEGNKCYGPGIFDMKSGNLIAIEAIRMLQKENKLNDKRLKVLQVAGIYDQNISISDQFNQLESKFIDFDSKKILQNNKVLSDAE